MICIFLVVCCLLFLFWVRFVALFRLFVGVFVGVFWSSVLFFSFVLLCYSYSML